MGNYIQDFWKPEKSHENLVDFLQAEKDDTDRTAEDIENIAVIYKENVNIPEIWLATEIWDLKDNA